MFVPSSQQTRFKYPQRKANPTFDLTRTEKLLARLFSGEGRPTQRPALLLIGMDRKVHSKLYLWPLSDVCAFFKRSG
ncbi:hypothetical protein CEXT_18271 [Caerostris extrusa]|uniref:Uncharacterized protein n=1 Tax=Caerostris extrusa TaxID=172846 RepID=A0AAV4VYV0_CAEEX|nr:hypothetical protein CEXT_18271 [Caerostris extrusa]